MKNVRAYRITVGTEELPRVLPPAELPALKRPDRDKGTVRKPPGDLPAMVPSAEPDLSGPSAAPPPAIQPDLRAFSEPGILSPASGSQPIVGPRAVLAEAIEVEEAVGEKVEAKSPPEAGPPETGDPTSKEKRSKPWLLALFGLFGSLGGNVYLIWVAADFRRRYYSVVQGARGGPDALLGD